MADCMTSQGYTEAEDIRLQGAAGAAAIRKAAAIANAVDNANQLIKNRKKQRDIADRAMKISEEQQSHLENVFYPREDQMIEEFGLRPEPIESIDVKGRRYAGRLTVKSAQEFAKRLKAIRCKASRYCTSATVKDLQDVMITRAQAYAQAKGLGRVAAFNENKALEERNWNRQKQVAGMGKGLMNQAAQLMQGASSGLGDSGKNYAAALNNSLEAIGFAGNGGQQRSSDSDRARMQGVVNNADYNQFNPVSDMQSFPSDYEFNQAISSGVPVDDKFMMEGRSPWASPLRENQMNKGRMGNFDLARNGSKTYTFTDSDGDRGEITVNMSDFPFIYTDNKTQGET